jgi:membrane associated rhomboid family serine protease
VSAEREPIFNAPAVVGWTLAALAAIHIVRQFLTPAEDEHLLLLFAFLPVRYGLPPAAVPGGLAADAWTFVTYAGLHASFTHLIVNGVWLLAFGSPVAWRFGGTRFLLFAAVTAAAGAAAHLASHLGAGVPLVGASAGISGLTAAALRFVFHSGGPLGLLRRRGAAAFRQPAVPLLVALRTPQVVLFVAVWFGINLLYGVSGAGLGPVGAEIAWQAHLGGFVAGLLLFPLFDPVRRGS